MKRLKYVLPLLGGFLAMATHIYLAYGFGDWFAPQRFRDAVGVGLIFGHLVALMIYCSRDLAQHFNSPIWIKHTLTKAIAVIIGMLAWWTHSTLFLLNTTPDWAVLLLGGVGLSVGFWFSIQARTRILFLGLLIVTTLAIFLPIWFTFRAYLATFTSSQPATALLYFQPDNPEFVWLVGLPFALCIAIFGHIPHLFVDQRN